MREVTPSESVLAELGAYNPAPMTPAQIHRSRTAQRLAIEHGVTGALSRAFDLREAAPHIVRVVCEELRWTCGAVWFDETQTDALECVGVWSQRNSHVEDFLEATRGMRQLATQGGLVRRAWLTGEPVWIRDVTAVESFRRAPQAARAGLHSAFAFPIIAGGRVLGVVEFYSRHIAELDAELLDCTRYIGSQIGQFCLRAQVQAQLRQNEKRYADTIELAAIGISHVDDSGRYVQVNRSLCDMLGYTRDELLGLTVKQISHPDDRNVADDLRARLRAGEIDSFQVEKRYLHKDGSTVWAQISVSVQRDATTGRALHDISITQDISARKQAELAVQRSEQRLRSLVELSSDWYWELDAELRFVNFGGRGLGDRVSRLLRGRAVCDLFGGDDSPLWAEVRAGGIERREPFRDFE